MNTKKQQNFGSGIGDAFVRVLLMVIVGWFLLDWFGWKLLATEVKVAPKDLTTPNATSAP